VKGKEVQEWLERGYVNGQPSYFVIGYRTFIDARVSWGENKEIKGSGKITAPISEALSDPSGSADLQLKGGGQGATKAKVDTETPGERIYAVCYTKVTLDFHDGEPKVRTTDQWVPFTGKRGKVLAEEKYLEAIIEDKDESAGVKIAAPMKQHR
jgi:hypothetical protein